MQSQIICHFILKKIILPISYFLKDLSKKDYFGTSNIINKYNHI
jgi:hypothetical protein